MFKRSGTFTALEIEAKEILPVPLLIFDFSNPNLQCGFYYSLSHVKMKESGKANYITLPL
jgi:hypothetical protein